MSRKAVSLLPDHVRPTKYRITLGPNLNDFAFWGEETVDIEVQQETSEIVLNAAELEIREARLRCRDEFIEAGEIHLDASAETVTLRLARPVAPGAMQLFLRFSGILNDRLRGFYRSEYTAPDGSKRVLATTQFEAADARRTFPCWDEPALKASFHLSAVIPADLTAISNMPATRETPHESGKLVEFAESPVMSTYPLALMVGEFERVQDQAGKTLIRVWTTPGKKDQGRFALDVARRLLGFYEDYFGIPYPLPKLDLIAIPDFAAGAMENWGAITYRETALLVDPAHSSAATRQRVAVVVAHEIAHMWFGNLVTMEWWNDLWLNEGFASWIEYKAVDHLFPEWDMWTQFVSADLAPALSLDGLRNSHPVEAEIKSPDEINELFDAISYNKGASIIRMLEQFLGEETFRRGLARYLSAHAYGNARTEDLWAALEEESGRPVKAIMDTWTKQAGYPFLTADRKESQDRHLTVALSQRRFFYDRDPVKDAEDPSLWRIPVGIRSAGAPDPFFTLMEEREATVSLPDEGGDTKPWTVVNAGRTGVYRVNYSPEMWEPLRPAVESLELAKAERLGLQADAFALMRAGCLPATEFLSLSQAYVNESEYPVWSDLVSNLGWIANLLAHEPYFDRFRALARSLLCPIVSRMGWDPEPQESHLDALLRGTVIQELGYYGEETVLREATTRFSRFTEDAEAVHPDLRSAVLNLAAFGGNRTTYEALRQVEMRATLQEEKVRALTALTYFDDPELLGKALELSLSKEVRSQDTIRIVGGVGANPRGHDLAWEFVKANWEEFDRRYGRGGFLLMRLIESVSSHFATPEKEEEVAGFFRAHPVPSATRTVQQCLERIRLHARWLEQNRDSLARWLK